jgi:hypothetical protein
VIPATTPFDEEQDADDLPFVWPLAGPFGAAVVAAMLLLMLD